MAADAAAIAAATPGGVAAPKPAGVYPTGRLAAPPAMLADAHANMPAAGCRGDGWGIGCGICCGQFGGRMACEGPCDGGACVDGGTRTAPEAVPWGREAAGDAERSAAWLA